MAGVLPGLGVGVTAFAPACSGVRRASSTATGAFPCAPTPPRAAGPPAPHAVARRGRGARCHAAGAAACPPPCLESWTRPGTACYPSARPAAAGAGAPACAARTGDAAGAAWAAQLAGGGARWVATPFSYPGKTRELSSALPPAGARCRDAAAALRSSSFLPAARAALLRRPSAAAGASSAARCRSRRSRSARAAIADPASATPGSAEADPLAMYVQKHGGKRLIRKARPADSTQP
jgi:hypothetical protein